MPADAIRIGNERLDENNHNALTAYTALALPEQQHGKATMHETIGSGRAR